jgi:hypothetical protein
MACSPASGESGNGGGERRHGGGFGYWELFTGREEERAAEREGGEGEREELRRGILILVQGAAGSILADDGEAAHRAASAGTRSTLLTEGGR